MSDFIIIPVSPAAFDQRWEEVKPMLESALPVALGRFEPMDVFNLLVQNPNASQGWFVLKKHELYAVAVTQIVQYPRRRCMAAFLIAGKQMKEWFEEWNSVVESYAIRMGCDHMEAQGRPGWQKVLDLEPKATFLVKELPIPNKAPDEKQKVLN